MTTEIQMKTVERAGLNLPARTIPVPSTISAEAQAALAQGSPYGNRQAPPAHDKAAWRRHVEESNRGLTEMMAAGAAGRQAPSVVALPLDSATLYEVAPVQLPANHEAFAILYVHGGGFTVGGGVAAAYPAMGIADLAQVKTFSIDYRMPPDFPFPAGLNDSVAAYRWLLTRYSPANIAIYGPSAGGGLAASLVLKARDIGLPMPAACVLHSPEADLTESGDTFETNNGIDNILTRLTSSIALYADGHDLSDPYLSPLFADFSKGFPPALLSSGTRDLFLSNTVLMHRALRRAGVKAELHVWEAMSHGGFFGAAPEDHEVLAEQIRFIHEHLGKAQPPV
jgi:monoterpene epsilon-lactone hydrolase